MAGRFDDILARYQGGGAAVPAVPAASGKYADILAKYPAASSHGNQEPYEPTMLESAAENIRGIQNKLAPALGAARTLQDVVMPGSGIPEMAMDAASSGLDAAEGAGAEYLGKKGVNPYLAAGGIKGAELLGTMALPSPKGMMSSISEPLAAPIATAGKGALSATLGPTMEAITARSENPAAIANAPTHLQIAERLPKTVTAIGDKITAAKDAAGKFLRSSPDPQEGAIPRAAVQGLLKNLQDSLQIGGATVSEAAKSASSKLGSLFSDIGKVLEPQTPAVETQGIVGPSGKPISIPRPTVFLPETDIKKIVDIAGKNIDWEDKGASVANSALTDFQTRLNGVLKDRNPEFAKAMRPVAALTKLYNDAQDTFSLTKRTGEGIQPTDTTVSKMASLPKERKGISQNVARRVDAATGQDLIDQSKNADFRKQFEGGRTNGSRRVNLGGIIGGGIGAGAGALLDKTHAAQAASVGGVLGATAGALADSFGGQIAAKFIDNYVALNEKISAAAGSVPADAIRKIALNLTFKDLHGGNQ